MYHPVLRYCSLDTKPCEDLEFKCETTGRFADPTNANKYIWCLSFGTKFVQLKYSCPVGKVFDGVMACVEPSEIAPIETFALSGVVDPENLYSTSRHSLSFQNNDETDEELYEESDETVANRIYLNSNEDASIINQDGERFRL